MEIYCTRPGCPRPRNLFPDLDDRTKLKEVPQKFCTACGMPLILDNRYFTTKLLGQGGFGAAFLARDRRTPNMRSCVVKQFLPSGNLSPNQLLVAQRLFEREAEVLEDLGNRHAQIPDLLAFFPLEVPGSAPGQQGQFFYIVQEFVDGKDMETELAERGQFSEAEVVEILTEMLNILQFVHENGSIHRDIKPSNIMRRRDGRLFLLDFGAVKQVTAGASATQPGKASTGIYSIGFAPPEQMRGDDVYPATDLYALAVTCIMLLTGKQPKELHDPYSDTWNWQSYAQVNDRLAAVLNRLLLPVPSQRFQAANQVLMALQPLSSSSPQAPPTSLQPSGQSSAGTAAGTAGPQSAVQSSTGATGPAIVPPSQPSSQPLNPVPNPVPNQLLPPPGLTPVPRGSLPQFTLTEMLSSAAFTGFEGGLLAIALASLLGTVGFSPLFWVLLLAIMAGLLLAQTRRWLEKVDFVIIAGVTLLAVWLVPFNLLHRIVLMSPLNEIAQALGLGAPILMILLIAGFSGLVAIAGTALFRLIYNLLSRFL